MSKETFTKNVMTGLLEVKGIYFSGLIFFLNFFQLGCFPTTKLFANL